MNDRFAPYVAIALCGFVHLVVIAAIIGMACYLWYAIRDVEVVEEQDRYHTKRVDYPEIVLRVVALAAGLILFLVGKVYGLSIPDLMASYLNVRNTFTQTVLTAVPAATGVSVAWACVRMMQSDSDIGKR
jgi:Ca2+/Na+ antiporter